METDEHAPEPSTLQKLRNMWQFANLMQYIHLFADALKIDREFDIDVGSPIAPSAPLDALSHAHMEQSLTVL